MKEIVRLKHDGLINILETLLVTCIDILRCIRFAVPEVNEKGDRFIFTSLNKEMPCQ